MNANKELSNSLKYASECMIEVATTLDELDDIEALDDAGKNILLATIEALEESCANVRNILEKPNA